MQDIARDVTGGHNPQAYLDAVREGYPEDNEAFNIHVWTDLFRFPAISATQAATAAGPGGWLYRFDLPATLMFVGESLGATHAAEVPFTFNRYATDAKATIERYDGDDPVVIGLAQRWSDTVIAFAKTGDPNGAGLPHWPRYDATQRQTMVLDSESRIATGLEREPLAIWQSLGPEP